ncbi:hypothetical protein DFH27DRAFT_144671 [Peziza echinospora]|nr:hypothetical protein DFH27DRAFT_144671 [Peziza echinospora]
MCCELSELLSSLFIGVWLMFLLDLEEGWSGFWFWTSFSTFSLLYRYDIPGFLLSPSLHYFTLLIVLDPAVLHSPSSIVVLTSSTFILLEITAKTPHSSTKPPQIPLQLLDQNSRHHRILPELKKRSTPSLPPVPYQRSLNFLTVRTFHSLTIQAQARA